MTFKQWLRVGAILVGITVGADSAHGAPHTARYTFVLVHGAWLGANSWDPVAKQLRKHAAEVVQVELPAHGHDATPPAGVTLDGYAEAVVKAIGPRERIILVGHSFGGIVISAAAERIPQHIAKLIYVAAYLPRDGESAYSLSQLDHDSHVGKYWTQENATAPVVIRQDGLLDVFCNDCIAAAQQFVRDNSHPEPLGPMGTPVHLSADRYGSVARYYISTREDHAVSYSLQQLMLGHTSAKQVYTLTSGHLPMLTQSDAVAKTLLRFAGDSSP